MKGLLKSAGRMFFPVLFFLSLLLHVRFLAIAALALGVGVWGWRQSGSGEAPMPVPATLQEAVDAACLDVPRSLPRPQRALRPTLVLPLDGDRELLVTQGIRRALEQDGGYRPVDKGKARELLDELFDLAGVPRQDVTDADTALGMAKAAGAEVVLFGQVERLELRDGQAAVSFSLRAFELGSEQPLLVGNFPAAPPAESSAAETPPAWGWMLGVLAVAVFWPLLTIPVMARVLRMESNAATLMTIVGVTAVPALVAWPLFFGTAVVAGRVIVFAVALLLVGLWSALVMSWVAARAEESV
jgi:hypothetical protein